MNNGYHAKVSRLYDEIRSRNNKESVRRNNEIQDRLPEAIDLDFRIKSLSAGMARRIMKNDASADDIRREIETLRRQRKELLTSNGYDENYLKPVVTCPDCNDTGYDDNNRRCHCYNEKLASLVMKDSEFFMMMEDVGFERFDIERFSDDPKDALGRVTPRMNMLRARRIAELYIESFPDSGMNLLFTGNSGTGKTYLATCIARELLKRGHIVIYRTAGQLIDDIRRMNLSDNEDTKREIKELLIDSHCLIIDDLGTENQTDYSKSEILNLINRRLLLKKSMVISTNFDRIQLKNIYTERLQSRLDGEFTTIPFFGPDLRVQKSLENQKAIIRQIEAER